MAIDLILGTAGHIDHGKTSLTGVLTGVATDRLPEEKKRGITIELGYAHLDLPPYRLGIVDVPGHEKFVRQMLAGATGMDIAMLVIAADDSVKQQTREHLDILRLLDLPCGVIALTKCDLVETDWLDLVEEEIRGLVEGSFLEEARIVRTSSKTGMGIDDLKEALADAAAIAAESDRQQRIHGPFRMAIDRTFTMEGYGTVVTGSVSSGSVNVGDQILVQPGGHEVRVRGIQNHDSASEEVHRGQRAAINLAGIHHQEIGRGHELSATGHLVPSELLTVEINLLSTEKKPFKDRSRVRFHVGTAELFGNVRLLGQTELAPGERCFAQIFLNEPAVATWNQPFVIRRQSPVQTIGGGRVLHPNPSRLRKPSELDHQMVAQMGSRDPVERASASLYFSDNPETPARSLARMAGIVDPESVFQKLIDDGDLIEIKLSATRTARVHKDRFEIVASRVIHSLERMHRNNPLRFSHPQHSVEAEFAYLNQPELVSAVLVHLAKEKQIIRRNKAIGLSGYGPKLSKGERAVMEQLIHDLRGFQLKPPSAKELQQSAKKNRDSVPQLLSLAAENGDLVKATEEMYFHSAVIDETKTRLVEEFSKSDGLTMSEIRQLLDVSRKYSIPLCEYLDASGFTKRDGDKRFLNEASEPAS